MNWTIGPQSEYACSWCMLGAIKAVTKTPSVESAAVYALVRFLRHGADLAWFNDTPGRKHKEVLAVFDKAIAAERAKQRKLNFVSKSTEPNKGNQEHD